MMERFPHRPETVIGPFGEPLKLADLPPPDTARWVIRRKAQVVAAVNGGLLTAPEACLRYGLTREELDSWQHAVMHEGILGLRATRIQKRRQEHDRRRSTNTGGNLKC